MQVILVACGPLSLSLSPLLSKDRDSVCPTFEEVSLQPVLRLEQGSWTEGVVDLSPAESALLGREDMAPYS